MRIRNSLNNAFNSYFENGKIATSKKYGIDYKAIINKLGLAPADGYDIDHIIPVSLFNHDDKEQVKLCWSAENLQWMEHKANITKKDYISHNMEDYPEELHDHWKVAYKNYLENKGD